MKNLKNDQMKMLLEILAKYEFSKDKVKKITSQASELEDVKLIEEVLDLLTNELTSNGLGEGDEPNKYGLQVEDLITFFSNLLIRLR